jgi:GNAT superfamily N-acetyltransferase
MVAQWWPGGCTDFKRLSGKAIDEKKETLPMTATPDSQIYDLSFFPLTMERWPDFEKLFGPRGANGGCWCMWWRQTRAEYQRQRGEANRRAMQRIVASGEIPGILAYHNHQAVGWCSVAPRENFASLNRSPVLKPIDALPVWSIVCFFVRKDFRQRKMTLRLIRAAVDYAASQGARRVEAYPRNPGAARLTGDAAFMGLPSVFQQAGFLECSRPSPSRIIMRRELE